MPAPPRFAAVVERRDRVGDDIAGRRGRSRECRWATSFWSLDHGAISDPASTLDESLPHTHEDVPWRRGSRRSRTPRTDGGVGFDAPSDERTVHVDQYAGGVVSTYGFNDYPTLAKVVSQGIGLHEGRTFGSWSMAGSTLMCLLVIASCVTGPLMGWKRRPSGSIGAPRGRLPLRGTPVLLVGLVALGIFLRFLRTLGARRARARPPRRPQGAMRGSEAQRGLTVTAVPAREGKCSGRRDPSGHAVRRVVL